MEIFNNKGIVARFDELIQEGEQLDSIAREAKRVEDAARVSQWATSSLNLLDKLSISSNRFVTEFERYGHAANNNMNIGLALGVLRSARDEYSRGLAIEYHLSVSAAIFGNLIEESEYLLQKGYLRASAVIAGAALEEGLKARARAVPLEVARKDTLTPVIHKLKANGTLTEFEAKKLEACGAIRNEAAHGGEFKYSRDDIEQMLRDVREALARLLGRQ